MLTSVKALFLDLEGTVYFKKKLIPGAQTAIKTLRENGYILRFLTNTDSLTSETLCRRLNDFGIPAETDEIVTPVYAAINFLTQFPNVSVFPLVSDELMPLFRPFVRDSGPVEYVVIGDFRDKVNYPLMNKAFRYIDAGASLLALQKERFFYTPEGKNIDTGAFVSLFEFAAESKATLLGKPSPLFFKTTMDKLGLKSNEVCVVGDDLTSDIKGAHSVGSPGILVRTGKFSDQVTPEQNTMKADYTVDSIGDLPGLFQSLT